MNSQARTHHKTLTLQKDQGESARELHLKILDGPDRGRSLLLRDGTVIVGTSPDADLRLSDGTVSRQHCTIERLAHSIRVTDLESKNGTLYQGARFQTLELPVGAIVQVGSTKLLLAPSVTGTTVSDKTELAGLVGCSTRTRKMFAEIERLAPTELNVLVFGETGSGKEATARALHQLSTRSAQPFCVFDCTSVHGELIHSQLFGHVKGSFTGADRDHVGAFAEADGGTLFLDEIAELAPELQPVLLRVLETGVYRRLGESIERKANVRVLCATHQDLAARVQEGLFRADLFYRLAAYTLAVPPLRERPEDIGMLVEQFGGRDLPNASVITLHSSQWPGNVRELRNAVQRLQALGDGPLPSDELSSPQGFFDARNAALSAFSKMYLQSLLKRHNGLIAEAAKEAGVATSYLYKLLVQHGLARSGPRTKDRREGDEA